MDNDNSWEPIEDDKWEIMLNGTPEEKELLRKANELKDLFLKRKIEKSSDKEQIERIKKYFMMTESEMEKEIEKEMLNRDKRKLDDKQRPSHNGMYSGNDFDSDINKLSLNSLLNNFLISLDSYDEARTNSIEQLKNLYNKYGNEFLDNVALYNRLRVKPHIEKLIYYYIKNDFGDEQSIIEKIYWKAYKKGYQRGDAEGYKNGYATGYDIASNEFHEDEELSSEDSYEDGYDAGYKDGYDAALEEKPHDEGSAFNGYYGADGGFHEYNNGWEGE